jgi:hypothetical protein
MLPSRPRGGNFGSQRGFATANVLADGVNLVVKPLGVFRAVALDFLNHQVYSNHISDLTKEFVFMPTIKPTFARMTTLQYSQP